MTKDARTNDLDRTCPHCSGRGAPILWGLPSHEYLSLNAFFGVAYGGCCISEPTPGRRCDSCAREFGDVDEVDWSPMERLLEYRDAVSKEMTRVYAITWDDVCGEWEPLAKARQRCQPPEQFVAWWGEKYDLELVVNARL